MKNLWSELRRRGVFKALGIYAASAFVLVQAADIVFPALGLPPRAMTMLVVLSIAGAPVAFALAWLFELTAEGVVREDREDSEDAHAIAGGSQLIGRRATLIIGVAAGALGSGFLLLAGFMTVRESAGSPETASAPGVVRVAVMPLKILGTDTGIEYLAEGLTEELIGALARIEGLAVLARSTVYSYKDTEQDPLNLGRALEVDAILSGTIRSMADDLRVGAQLIDVGTGVVLWSENFEGSVKEVFAIQDSITSAVVAHFSSTPSMLASRVAAGATENAEAYELYLKGRYFWNKRTAQGIATAIDYFTQAIEVDPQYARAYVGVADALIALSQFGVRPGSAVLPQAEAASRRALELGVNEAEIFSTAAHVAELYYRDWPRAEQLYQRALALDPTFGTAHAWYGDLLMSRGRMEESLEEMTKAARLEPLSPPILFQQAATHLRMGHLKQAEEGFLAILELEPGYLPAVVYLAHVYVETGDGAKALALIDQASRALPGQPIMLSHRALALARTGRPDEARALLAELDRRPASAYVPASYLAAIYANLGELEKAVEYLRSYVEENGNVMFLARDPWWAPLRSYPAYLSLMAELGLPTR